MSKVRIPDGRGGTVVIDREHIDSLIPHAHQGTRIVMASGLEHHVLVEHDALVRELDIAHLDVPTLEPVETPVEEATGEGQRWMDDLERVTAERDAALRENATLRARVADLEDAVSTQAAAR